jgi:hypothetical protein
MRQRGGGLVVQIPSPPVDHPAQQTLADAHPLRRLHQRNPVAGTNPFQRTIRKQQRGVLPESDDLRLDAAAVGAVNAAQRPQRRRETGRLNRQSGVPRHLPRQADGEDAIELFAQGVHGGWRVEG